MSTNPAPKKLILCVDDEKVVLTSLIGQLSNAFGTQYHYEGFTASEEALEYLEELKEEGTGPQLLLVISDWLMPKLRGDEFLIKVRALFSHTRLILLSGHADPESVERAINLAGLQKFMSKPWSKEELVHEVELAIAG